MVRYLEHCQTLCHTVRHARALARCSNAPQVFVAVGRVAVLPIAGLSGPVCAARALARNLRGNVMS